MGGRLGQDGNVLNQLLGVLAGNHLQHQRVGDGLGVCGIFLQRLVQRRLRLLCAAEVQFRHGLRDQRLHRRRRRRLRELLEDVKGLLVSLTALL